MRITAKGQVTIPREIRERFGLTPGAEIDLVVEGTGLRIIPRSGREGSRRGAEVLRRLRGTGTIQMSTDEILGLTREP